MEKASRKLLLALLTIAVCLALLAAGTYALFSREFGVTNHLVAGNLDVTLTRTKLETKTVGEGGYLVTTTDNTSKDFTDASGENLFGIKENVKVAPGCKFTADLKLTNGGTVAFTYWIEVIVKDGSKGKALAEQLKVSVKAGDGEAQEGKVSDGLSIGSKESGIGVVVVGKEANFTVSVEFSNLDTNNAAQNQDVEFDLVIHALQYVGGSN